MGYRTYTVRVGSHELKIKAKKKDAERLSRTLGQVVNINKYHKELGGIVGKPETQRASVLYSVFGSGAGTVANPQQLQQDAQALFSSLPSVIEYDDFPTIKEQALDVFNKHVPTIDKRRTPEDIEENHKRLEEQEKKRLDKLNAFIDQHGQHEQVTVPKGKSAILLEMNYNDSDPMTDYFNAHRSVGINLLLGWVDSKQRRESTVRSVVEKYPELAKLEWRWYTEDYRGGHGYWLESEPVTTLEGVETYGGRKAPNAWWEVKLNSYGGGKEYYPYKHFPGKGQAATSEGVTVERDRAWVWVGFPSKPDAEILDALKALGGRWSRKRSKWYFAGCSEETEAELRGLLE